MTLRKDHRLLLTIQEVKNLGQEMDTYVNIRVLKKPEKLNQEPEPPISPTAPGTAKRDSVNSLSKRKTLPPLPATEEEDLYFRTSTVWKNESPFFGDDFEINLGDFHVVLIELYQKKILKDQHLGTISLGKDTLIADNTIHEDWNAIDGDKANKPSIRFKYIYLNESILPLHDYGNLMNLLFDETFWLIRCMDRTAEDREEVAKVMVRISVSCESDVKLLSHLLKLDVEKTLTANVLFRANSIASKALDYYMKLTAMHVMRNALEPVVKEIMLQNRSCEIDFTRLESKEKYEENFTVLEAYIRWTVDRIFASLKEWPTHLRIILGNLRESVINKWPDNELVKYYCISGFLFLRLFSAAMLGPKLWQLTDTHPNYDCARTFTLISKVIQQLANLVPFDKAKEPFMNPLNEYLESQFPRMKKFIDEIAETEGSVSGDKSKKAGTMSRMFNKVSKKRTSIISGDIHSIDTELECTSLSRLIRKQFDKMQQVQVAGDQIDVLKSALDQMVITKAEKEKTMEEEPTK